MISCLMDLFESGLLVAIGLSAVYYGVTSVILREKFKAQNSPASSLEPITLFRPIKPGLRDLKGKLELLAEAARTEDQILVGVSSEAEAVVCRSVSHVQVIVCAPDRALNPKINKLLQMAPFARHEQWVVSDSEALITREFLETFRAECHQTDVLTAGYRFQASRPSLPEAVDQAAVLMTLWPGLAVAPIHFTLGACTGVRRKDIEAIGGWEALHDYLAEDYRLGAELARRGRRIQLSRAVLDLESEPRNWREFFSHQRRVAVTYRVCNPAGYFGMILIQGIPLASLLALLRPGEGWRWLLLGFTFGLRWLTTTINARTLGFRLFKTVRSVAIQSYVETAFWIASWSSSRVRWGHRRFRVDSDGRISI